MDYILPPASIQNELSLHSQVRLEARCCPGPTNYESGEGDYGERKERGHMESCEIIIESCKGVSCVSQLPVPRCATEKFPINGNSLKIANSLWLPWSCFTLSLPLLMTWWRLCRVLFLGMVSILNVSRTLSTSALGHVLNAVKKHGSKQENIS